MDSRSDFLFKVNHTDSIGRDNAREKNSHVVKEIRTAPVSFSQLQMWIIDQIQPGNHAYNLPVGFRLKGNLDIIILENSFNEIIKRHEILRTTFSLINGKPSQQIHPGYQLKIRVINIENTPYEQRSEQLNKITYEEAVRPFNLSELPLIRVTVLHWENKENILLLNLHHIISDGWSLGIIFRELSILYNCNLNGTSPELPDLEFQYSDYVSLQLEKNWKPGYEEQLEFWKKQLDGVLPYTELPCDKKRSPVQSLNGSNEFFFLPNQLIKSLQSIGFKKGCSFYMTILAAFQSFLYKYSCGDDIIIGTPVSNRPRKSDEILIGNFINILAIRADLKDDPEFPELLRRIRKITINALTNRDLPFEDIVEHLKIRRDLSRNPVFQVMLQVLPKYSFEINGLEITSFNFDLGYSQVDISFHLYQVTEGYQCRIEYDTDLFDSETIARMAVNFQYFLNQLAENSNRRISQIPFLHNEEEYKILHGWNNTHAEFPGSESVISLFEKTVTIKSDSAAVQFGEKILSYNELNVRANLISDYLLSCGVKPGSLVGICIDRSLEMVISLLGIMKTGAAYLPLDPSFPSERLNFITEDAGLSVLITNESLRNIFPRFSGKVISIDKEWKNIKNGNDQNTNITIDPVSIAYVIYTSGSSGQPKGVMIEHRSAVNFLTSMQSKPGLNEDDVLLAVTTISFDISVLEIFLPLISGAKLVIAGKHETIDGYLLLKLIRKTSATILQATPSTWKLMLSSGWSRTPDLKMLCGGEALPKDLADKMLERGKELWNMYGPTETTVWSSVKKIESDQENILLGPPIANTQFYVVDKNMQPVPIGVPGELLIGGTGLARGYLNRPELDEQRFIKISLLDNGRLYRTGDLVKYLPGGEIEFLGRTDFQIKLRGFRIELEEIEKVLAKLENIKETIVAVKENKNRDLQLVAYILPTEGKELKLNELRTFLKLKLPEYMIPSVFISIDKFPLTPNAKIDRKALPDPESGKMDSEQINVAPRNELETKIAEIWERILGIGSIGINDNFFDLGGHSLLAVQMFAELERVLGIKLPIVTLFEHQNISDLASIIKTGTWKEKWSSLIQIKSGSKTPLFLIHGAEGNVLVYKDLANYLDKDQPFYALQSRGLDGSENTIATIEGMAAYYIEEIKKVQPKGPYNLGGYCLGGTIAFEMARQFSGSGDEVKNIFLIETYNICSAENPINKMTMTDRIENVKFHFSNLRILNKKDKIKFIINKSEVIKRRIASNLSAILSKVGLKVKDTQITFKATYKIREINDKAQVSYRPKEYNGKTVLLKPKVNYSSAPDPEFGWNKLVLGEFKIYSLEIAPRGMLYEPFVKETAAIINQELDGSPQKQTVHVSNHQDLSEIRIQTDSTLLNN